MLKKISTIIAFVGAIGVAGAAAANTLTGRITGFTPTSLSVFDKEVITVTVNADTTFTKLIEQKPWQADTALTATALRVGGYVVVHADKGVANWVQVATDAPLFVERTFAAVTPAVVAAPVHDHAAEAAARRRAPNASESKRPGGPDTALHCERLAHKAAK